VVNTIWIKEVSRESIDLVGGKAANLGELAKNRFPVPSGFVVTADAWKLFLEKTKIQDEINKILNYLDVEDSNALKEASEKIQNLILSYDMPYEVILDIKKYYKNINNGTGITNLPAKAASLIHVGRDYPFVAVRSSATAEDLPEASFAGQQATYLNVKGEKNIIQAIHQCWASLYTARAIYYRVKNNFDHSKVFIAVVIQKMVNSKKSGIIFTINPVNNKDEMVIDAGFGLGDAIVSGAVSPNTYTVDKTYWSVLDKKIPGQKWMLIKDIKTGRTVKVLLNEEKSKKQVLADEEIIVLAKLAKKIEDHYDFPQDIEYAIEDNRLYIVQTRPVTTKKKVEEIKEEKIEGEVILEGIAASPGIGIGKVKIIKDLNELGEISEGDVLVTKMTSPDMVPIMKKVAAIVTDEGGSNCHAAIVSRELGVPAVVGTQKATEVLKNNSLISVDGTNGKIYSGKIEKSEEKIEEMSIDVETKTKVKVNLDMPEVIDRALKQNPDGVGLVRLEFIIGANKIHPLKYIKEGRRDEYVNILVENLRKIAKPFGSKPVWIRTSDIRSDEYSELDGGYLVEKESNPMMGWHAIRMSLDEEDILKSELKAVRKLREEGISNISVMLPMITHKEQIIRVKEIMDDIGLNCDLGIMVETPAAVETIKSLCETGIKFVSIGSNDLTQFILGVDRNNAKVQGLYDEMHPAVLKEISRVIRKCKEVGVEVSLCGQAGSREEMVRFLVEKGINSISANIDAVGKVRNIVAEEERK
jgi:pyruvate, water dikinase